MDTDNTTAPNLKKPITYILALILLTLLLFVTTITGYKYIADITESFESMLAEKDFMIQALVAEQKSLNEKIEFLEIQNCNGKWSKENGCENNLSLTISIDKSDKQCYGDTMEITWDPAGAPVDTVDILLTTPQTTLRLDTVRASSGLYEWKINPQHRTTTGGVGIANIPEGDLYKIRLQSGGQAVNNSESQIFTIASCG